MEDDELLAYYIEIGVIEIAGMDESGEIMFAINESAKELAPELWQSHKDYVDKSLLDLYEKELIEVEYDENLEPTFRVPEKSIELIKKMGLFPLEEE